MPSADPVGLASKENCSSLFEEYAIDRTLASGSFTRVYAVTRRADGQKLAVKVTDLRHASGRRVSLGEPPNLGALSGEGTHQPSRPSAEPQRKLCTRKKFNVLREVGILKKLKHLKHCTGFVDSMTSGHLAYIATELCEKTLLQALEQAPELNELLYKKVFGEMLQALASIHQLGVVHLDVRPGNFVCTGPQMTVKLCGFGAATTNVISGSGKVRGVLPFIAPEMLAGQWYNENVDVWSFGVIVYALLFGSLPYLPADKSTHAMKASIVAGFPVPQFQQAPGGHAPSPQPSSGALDFAQQVLCHDRMKRPSSCEALQHRWLGTEATSEGSDTETCMTSLRPTFDAAVREGAFSSAMLLQSGKEEGRLLNLYQSDPGVQRLRSPSPFISGVGGSLCASDEAFMVDFWQAKGVALSRGATVSTTAELSLNEENAAQAWETVDLNEVQSRAKTERTRRFCVQL